MRRERRIRERRREVARGSERKEKRRREDMRI